MNRTKLPTTRKSVSHRVKIGDFRIYITVGLYDNGQPGELFINDIRGPQVGVGFKGLANQWAIAISMLLQAGATVDELGKKFAHARYEPAGITDNDAIPMATSTTDYVMRFLVTKWGANAAEKGTAV